MIDDDDDLNDNLFSEGGKGILLNKQNSLSMTKLFFDGT